MSSGNNELVADVVARAEALGETNVEGAIANLTEACSRFQPQSLDMSAIYFARATLYRRNKQMAEACADLERSASCQATEVFMD